MGKPRAAIENIQPKQTRPLSNILPSNAIRPASSVSTQTGGQIPGQVSYFCFGALLHQHSN